MESRAVIAAWQAKEKRMEVYLSRRPKPLLPVLMLVVLTVSWMISFEKLMICDNDAMQSEWLNADAKDVLFWP